MTKIKMLAAAVAVASVSTMALAAAPTAPPRYDTGPLSPSANKTQLTVQERVAYALMEGVLQSTEAYVHANGCPSTPVSLPLTVVSDDFSDPIKGSATLGSAPDVMKFDATADNSNNFRGQIIDVAQTNDPAAQYINGKRVSNFVNQMIYNSANNMMVGNVSVKALGINGKMNPYTGLVIKDFYKGEDKSGAVPAGDNELFLIIDWGLQSLSKEGYPIEKYWQRSKVRRSDGGQGYTAFVKDRLVGVTRCRITLATSGDNATDDFDQAGTVLIEKVRPDATSDALNMITSPAA